MKKLLLLACALLMCIGVNAQIQMGDNYTNKVELIGAISPGANLGATSYSGPTNANFHIYRRVFESDTTLGIYVESTNPYDDNAEVALGHSIPETIASVKALLNFLDSNAPGTSNTITDINGNRFQFHVHNKNFLKFRVIEYYVGKTFVHEEFGVYIKRPMLLKALELLGEPGDSQASKSRKKK